MRHWLTALPAVGTSSTFEVAMPWLAFVILEEFMLAELFKCPVKLEKLRSKTSGCRTDLGSWEGRVSLSQRRKAA